MSQRNWCEGLKLNVGARWGSLRRAVTADDRFGRFSEAKGIPKRMRWMRGRGPLVHTLEGG